MQVNTEKTEMAVKAASTEISSFVLSAESEVKALEEKYASVVPDASSKEGYKHCKTVRSDLMPIKSGLETARATLKRPIIDAGKLIDGSLKPLVERVEALYKPFENAYREVDNEKKRKEEDRQQKVSLAFDRLTDFIVTASGSSSTVIETLINDLADFDLDPIVFMDRTNEAAAKHSEVMEKLGSMLLQAKDQEEFKAKQEALEKREREVREKEEAEVERVRQNEIEAQRVEQQRIDEEQRKKRETELLEARKEAQAKAELEAKKKHVRDLELAEQRAQEQAIQAAQDERRRIEQEQAQAKAEEKNREADKNHKASVHNDILNQIMTTGISEDQGKSIIKLVAQRKAGSMYIQY